jgi:hypothetical protein
MLRRNGTTSGAFHPGKSTESPLPLRERTGVGGKGETRLKLVCFCLILITPILFFSTNSFSGDKLVTKIIVRVVSKDAKVIGSGVGGALVRIKNLETGEVLAQGKQEGGTGDTDRIMTQPHRRGEVIYGTPDAAFFKAEIPLDRPTQVEVYAEAPLAYPHSIQKGSKTLTLIPGKHLLGEGLIIELNGLILNVLSSSYQGGAKTDESITVKVEVRML